MGRANTRGSPQSRHSNQVSGSSLPLVALSRPEVWRKIGLLIDSAVAAQAVLETWWHLVPALDGGWARARSGGLAGVTGVPAPTLNGVWVDAVDAEAARIGELLDEVAATGLPHCLQFRPGATGRLTKLAMSRSMTREEDIPLMALDDAGQLGAAQAVSGLTIRELSPAEAPAHARLAAAGFEAPVEMFLQLTTPALLAGPGVRCYVGERDGQPVTTGLGVTIGPYVAIFNIATPPGHRRHGYGAAVTARAVADGFSAGARWSWLQASPAGQAVYERLGFRTVETWQCWIAAGKTHE
jgi:ribosomal protein S18 acetylase RimI-like enzyme